jgi:hypothetical protein
MGLCFAHVIVLEITLKKLCQEPGSGTQISSGEVFNFLFCFHSFCLIYLLLWCFDLYAFS